MVANRSLSMSNLDSSFKGYNKPFEVKTTQDLIKAGKADCMQIAIIRTKAKIEEYLNGA